MPVDYTVQAQIAYLSWLNDEDSEQESWVRTLRDYADGRHPTYLTDRMKEFIGLESKNTSYLYEHNLCGLIIDTAVERLELTGFSQAGEAQSEAFALQAAEWWEANRMDAGQDDLYEAVCRDAGAYIIVDWDPIEQRPRWSINQQYDGTQGVKLHLDPSTNEPVFASKRWQTRDILNPGDGTRTRLTLYFPDRVERYISRREKDPIDREIDNEIMRLSWRTYVDKPGDAWPISWTDGDGNPLGFPVIQFCNPGGSEIDDVIELQDVLNKSDLDLVAAADTAAFRQLWMSGVRGNTNTSGQQADIDVGPGSIQLIADPQGRMSAIEPADLSRVIAVCKYWVESIAGISRTPHYLLVPAGADQPSGEALHEQEIGLINKCARKHKVLGNAWEDVLYLSRRLWNLHRPDEPIEPARLQAQWKRVDTRSEKEAWETAMQKQAAGIPQEQTWAELGYSQVAIERMKAMAQEESERRRANGDAMAETLLTNFDHDA